MYSIDGIKYVYNKDSFRLFLSGNNNFIKYYIVNLITSKTGRIPNYIDKKEFVRSSSTLFGPSKYFNVFLPNLDLFLIKDSVVVKFSNKKATKKIIKEMDVIEIICNDLFLNQVTELIDFHCGVLGVTIDNKLKYQLAYAYKDDLEALINLLNIGQVGNLNERLIDIPLVKLVNYFVEGNMRDFVRGFERTKEIYPILWLLIKKFEEFDLVLKGEKKYPNKYISNEINRLASYYKKINLNSIIIELYKIREKVMESGLNKNYVFLNHMLRLNLLVKSA